MKITKARLKEIINEELETAMTPEESIADGHAAAAEMRARIAASQSAPGYKAPGEEVAELRAKLEAARDKIDVHGKTDDIKNIIDRLEELLANMEP